MGTLRPQLGASPVFARQLLGAGLLPLDAVPLAWSGSTKGSRAGEVDLSHPCAAARHLRIPPGSKKNSTAT